MDGFDGDPLLHDALLEALGSLLRVFPEHLAKPQAPRWFEPDELLRNTQFDAILRAHKHDRLRVPIEALRAAGAPYHGFEAMTGRRLAWFVPAILASWLEGAPSRTHERFGAAEIEDIFTRAGEAELVPHEHAALIPFFELALDAALATPLRPARDVDHPRPLEDGLRVWSVHSPSVPLDVLRVARALGVAIGPLVYRWTTRPEPRALAHLVEAVYDTETPSKRLLAWDSVADRLGEAFFAAQGEAQARLSKAEATVRRNLARRDDFDVW